MKMNMRNKQGVEIAANIGAYVLQKYRHKHGNKKEKIKTQSEENKKESSSFLSSCLVEEKAKRKEIVYSNVF